MKFKEYNLKNAIKRALSELKIIEPLKVQEEVIPLIVEGKDLVVKSSTGSGKTAAFSIPLTNMLTIEDNYPQVIVIAPTRELALQINEDIKNIGRYLGIKSMAFFGKTMIKDNREDLKKYPHIVVATPGRLKDLLERKFLKTSNLKFLVLDEADELLNLGFKEQLDSIFSLLPKERKTYLFSATMDRDLEKIVEDELINPIKIDIKPEIDIHKKIHQIYYEVDEHKKLDFLRKMLDYEKPTKCIIFANTQNKVDSIFKIMRKWNDETAVLHGGIEQFERMRTISKFKRGELKYLIATDLASRGLHVRNLSHVINFNLPFEFESYVHRIGRTGRVNETGIAINLCSYKERERLKELQEYLGYDIERIGPKRRSNPKKELNNNKNTRFKINKNIKYGRIKLFAGRRSNLKAGTISSIITRIKDVDKNDVGKIVLYDDYTIIEVNEKKKNVIMSALKKVKFKGKVYRIKNM